MNAIGEVISIGDELTSGQRLDTNTQWLSQRLTELGIGVVFHTTVADDLEANVAVFRTAVERADIVVCTGGLGPTADDLTREALAAVAGVELVRDDNALAHIRDLFERRGREMPERNLVQAMFPTGSRPIFNPHGTAPGIEMELSRPELPACRLFALPGVPAEMHVMWERSVAPAIAVGQPAGRVIRHHCIKCFGAGESHIEAMLPDMIRRGRQPLVGITASSATITLRITAAAVDEVACLTMMEPTVAEIREKLGLLVFGEGDVELEDAVVNLLTRAGKSVATCEIASGGVLAQMLAGAAESQRCYAGGMVRTFATGPSQHLDAAANGKQMAVAALNESGADYGLAISEMSPDRNDSEALTVYIALADDAGVRAKGFPMFGDVAFARLRTAKIALNQLRLALLRQEL